MHGGPTAPAEHEMKPLFAELNEAVQRVENQFLEALNHPI